MQGGPVTVRGAMDPNRPQKTRGNDRDVERVRAQTVGAVARAKEGRKRGERGAKEGRGGGREERRERALVSRHSLNARGALPRTTSKKFGSVHSAMASQRKAARSAAGAVCIAPFRALGPRGGAGVCGRVGFARSRRIQQGARRWSLVLAGCARSRRIQRGARCWTWGLDARFQAEPGHGHGRRKGALVGLAGCALSRRIQQWA